MNVYRAYFLDDDNKITKAPKVLDCDGDDIEIWHGKRFVTVLKRQEKA